MADVPQTMPNGQPKPSEEQMKAAMDDMGHIGKALQAKPEDPNATISIETVLLACATSPCMTRIIPNDVPSKIDELEEAMKAEKIDMEWVKETSGQARRHAIALLWQLNRQRASLKEKDASLDGATAQHCSVAVQLATKLLVQSQMMFPQQRWVEATLAVARTSSLVANQLWSHTELEALVQMAVILKKEGLRRPKLRLEAVCEPKEVLPGAKVSVKVSPSCCRRPALAREARLGSVGRSESAAVLARPRPLPIPPPPPPPPQVMLLRHHAGFDGDEPPTPANPSGMHEAYWLYVAGVKADAAVAHSLLAAQPLAVRDLNEAAVEASIGFTAPSDAGVYKLRVHVISTSVIGVDLDFTAEFEVAADDVPPLM